jgi:hypothetical protein
VYTFFLADSVVPLLLKRGFFQTKLYGHDNLSGTPFVTHVAKWFAVAEPGDVGKIFMNKQRTVTVILKPQFRV